MPSAVKVIIEPVHVQVQPPTRSVADSRPSGICCCRHHGCQSETTDRFTTGTAWLRKPLLEQHLSSSHGCWNIRLLSCAWRFVLSGVVLTISFLLLKNLSCIWTTACRQTCVVHIVQWSSFTKPVVQNDILKFRWICPKLSNTILCK